MKKILFVFLLLFPTEIFCQPDEDLRMPKPGEVALIEISNTGLMNWRKPKELLELLPAYVPSDGTYLTKGAFERGVFVLRNGKKITWIMGDKDSILLYEGVKEQLYILPKEKKQQQAAGPLFRIWDIEGKEGFI